MRDYSLATLNLALGILGVAMLNPVKTPKMKMYLFGGFYYIVTYLYYYLTIMQLYHINGDIFILSRTVVSFTSFTQTSIKMLPIIYYREHIANLLYNRKYFWKNETGSPSDIKDIETFRRNGFIFARSFCGICALTVFMYFLKPIFTKELLTLVWVPDYPYAFEIILIGQYIYSPLLGGMLAGTVILYVSLSLDVMVQLKILGFNIRRIMQNAEINGSGDMQELRRCIKQHSFLLDYIKDVQRLFQLALLGEYLLTIGSTCMELYTLTAPASTINDKMISFLYVYILLFQFGLFCFPASYISHLILNVSNDFYFSNWEDGSMQMRKCIVFTIMRAQKDVTLKAGGMLAINAEAFANVFKTAFSFLTLMRSFRE